MGLSEPRSRIASAIFLCALGLRGGTPKKIALTLRWILSPPVRDHMRRGIDNPIPVLGCSLPMHLYPISKSRHGCLSCVNYARHHVKKCDATP